jgi:hypothetical protein
MGYGLRDITMGFGLNTKTIAKKGRMISSPDCDFSKCYVSK